MSDTQNDDRNDTVPGASNAADAPDNAKNGSGTSGADKPESAETDVHGEPENPAG